MLVKTQDGIYINPSLVEYWEALSSRVEATMHGEDIVIYVGTFDNPQEVLDDLMIAIVEGPEAQIIKVPS